MKAPAIAVGLLLCALAAAARAAHVQGQPSPAFEVASVKPSHPDPANPLSAVPLIGPRGGGRLTASNAPLRSLVLAAYGLEEFQVVGGPSWQTSRNFDVNAKAENPAATMTEMRAMLKTLLEDRFQLKAHVETREMSIGVLVVARGDGQLGPNLKPSTANCPSPEEQGQKMQEVLSKDGIGALQSMVAGDECAIALASNENNPSAGISLGMKGQPLSMLAAMLSRTTGKPVQDRTGLTGRYDFKLIVERPSQSGMSIPAGALPPSLAPSLLTAVREQLGLKLETDKAPGQVLVIDSAELPTAD